MGDMMSVLESCAARYRQLLQDEGDAVIAPDWTEDVLAGMMRLRSEGGTMYFLFDVEDSSFVRLVLRTSLRLKTARRSRISRCGTGRTTPARAPRFT